MMFKKSLESSYRVRALLLNFFPVSWCVVSEAEEKKCLDLAGKATAHHIKGTLQCVRGLNARDCIHKIKVLDETDLHLGKLIFQ